mmetsp:Transcript_54479/g.129403  ORF Transcript_54479/g.129403 Transcript_54479/m.129403 type:complete len:245 (-) Transcript_54479:642-1376(-)
MCGSCRHELHVFVVEGFAVVVPLSLLALLLVLDRHLELVAQLRGRLVQLGLGAFLVDVDLVFVLEHQLDRDAVALPRRRLVLRLLGVEVALLRAQLLDPVPQPPLLPLRLQLVLLQDRFLSIGVVRQRLHLEKRLHEFLCAFRIEVFADRILLFLGLAFPDDNLLVVFLSRDLVFLALEEFVVASAQVLLLLVEFLLMLLGGFLLLAVLLLRALFLEALLVGVFAVQLQLLLAPLQVLDLELLL